MEKRRSVRDNWAHALLVTAVISGVLVSGTQDMYLLASGAVVVIIATVAGMSLLK